MKIKQFLVTTTIALCDLDEEQVEKTFSAFDSITKWMGDAGHYARLKREFAMGYPTTPVGVTIRCPDNAKAIRAINAKFEGWFETQSHFFNGIKLKIDEDETPTPT